MERVRDRLRRASAALEAAGVPFAIVGGNAVAAWVATVDPSAVRNTQDVDILLRRSDLNAAAAALAAAGFVRRHVAGIDLFLDGSDGRPRDALHVAIAGEKVKPEHPAVAPDVFETARLGGVNVISLEALVRMELSSFGRESRMLLRDMIEVGLTDPSRVGPLSPELSPRLKELIHTPDA